MIIKKAKAFLLVEVLMTVVIISSAVIFINHAFTTSLKAAAISSDYLIATFLLEDKGFDVEFNPQEQAEKGESLSEEEFMEKKLNYNQEVLPIEDAELMDKYEEDTLSIKRLIFSALWKRQDAERAIDVQTYIATESPQEEEAEEE